MVDGGKERDGIALNLRVVEPESVDDQFPLWSTNASAAILATVWCPIG